MGPGTSLASCGIAFALKYLDASIQGGVELGFAPEEARAVVMQTMRGALEMMNLNGTMPQTEIDKVTTPGGMTLRGLAAMEESGFTEAVKAIQTGRRQSREQRPRASGRFARCYADVGIGRPGSRTAPGGSRGDSGFIGGGGIRPQRDAVA